eukprot:6541888-Alexandrium_andersonii.AAC.1
MSRTRQRERDCGHRFIHPCSSAQLQAFQRSCVCMVACAHACTDPGVSAVQGVCACLIHRSAESRIHRCPR